MVFLMHLGFATLESGLCQQKNVVNVLFKNVFIISIGIVTYALIGFNTHYPLGDWSGGIEGWLKLGSPINTLDDAGANLRADLSYGPGVGLCMTGLGDFIFQAMFAATGATIVSGAVAERVKALKLHDIRSCICGPCIPNSWFMALGRGRSRRNGLQGFCRFHGSTCVWRIWCTGMRSRSGTKKR